MFSPSRRTLKPAPHESPSRQPLKLYPHETSPSTTLNTQSYVRKREPLSLNNLEAPVILGILKLDGYLELGNN